MELTDAVRKDLRAKADLGTKCGLRLVAVNPDHLLALLVGEARARDGNAALARRLAETEAMLHQTGDLGQIAFCRKYMLEQEMGKMAESLRSLASAAERMTTCMGRTIVAMETRNVLAAPVPELAPLPPALPMPTSGTRAAGASS